MTDQHKGFERLARLGGAAILLTLAFGVAATPVAARTHTSAAPKAGGSYSVWLTGAPDCLDPQLTALAASAQVDNYVFDPLLSINPKGQFTGDLASNWSASKTQTTETFKLRNNAHFSNGDPVTAADVKFTFDRALNPATKSPETAGLLAAVKDVRVTGKYTVALDLKAPSRPLLTNLANVSTGILDPKAVAAEGSNTCNKPVGTGPYEIKSTGTSFGDITLVPNKHRSFAPRWFMNQGPPYVKTVQFVTITSEDTAISELLQGTIGIANIPPDQHSRVKGNKKIVLHNLPAQSEAGVEFNTKSAPFNTLAARQAVAEIINRPAIVKAALLGLGQSIYGPLPPGIPLYDKAAGKYLPKYSVNNAAKLVQKYHLTGPYNFVVPNLEFLPTMAEQIQAAAAQAGMTLNIQTVDQGTWVSDLETGSFQLTLLAYGYNDPEVLYLLFDSTGGEDFTGYNDPSLDNLLASGNTTLNTRKAQQIYYQAQIDINKAVIFAGGVGPTDILGVRTSLKGFHLAQGTWAPSDIYIG